MYNVECTIHSYLNLLIDVLHESNKLNVEFQYDMVDITTISAAINITLSILSSHHKSGNGPIFGHISKNLGKFLRESTRNFQLGYENNT